MLRLIQRLPIIISFGFLLILSAASAVFIHQVSPLRNPTFQPNSGNAGSLLPWMRGVYEDTWLWGASLLALLLAISLTLVLRQWSQAQIPHSGSQSQNTLRKIAGFLSPARWIAIGIILCIALWLVGVTHGSFYSNSIATFLIAALLALDFTFIFWLWNQLESLSVSTPWHGGVPRKIAQVFLFAHWIGIGAILFVGLWRLFIGYLLMQWLVD